MESLRTKNGGTFQKDELIFSKKAKSFYRVKEHPELAIEEFLDLVWSDDGQKYEKIPGKGRLNATINDMLFELMKGQYLDKHRTMPIFTHYQSNFTNSEAECLIKWVEEVLPLEVIIRNRADGSFSDRYGIPKGTALKQSTCEFTLKDDSLGDPLINDDHILALGYATDLELQYMREAALAANQIMIPFFQAIGIELIDFKLVFGRLHKIAAGDPTNLRLIGELSPDVFRLRDLKTGESLDKDIFRHGLPGLSEAYNTVLEKMSAYYRQPRKGGPGAYDEQGIPLK